MGSGRTCHDQTWVFVSGSAFRTAKQVSSTIVLCTSKGKANAGIHAHTGHAQLPVHGIPRICPFAEKQSAGAG